MIRQSSLGLTVVFVGLWSLAACEQTFHTGKVGNTRNAPNAEGACPSGLTVCGKDAFAQCLDLQSDRAHCGACNNACLPGIACVAGTCQQVACSGPVTVSTQKVLWATPPTWGHSFADVNGDGRPDLVSWGAAGGSSTKTFQVALGEAVGFAAAATYQTSEPPESIMAGDSNGDGFQDLYVRSARVGERLGRTELWLGHADGMLTLTGNTAVLGGLDGTLADLNGDGTLDYAANLVDGAGSTPTVYLADANGNFHVGFRNADCVGDAVLVRDWNGDSFPDLVAVLPTLRVCLNNGNGTFQDGIDCSVITASSRHVPAPDQVTVIVDLNRDGHLDVASAWQNSVHILLGMGGCGFHPMTEYPLSDVIQVLTSGDVNGDSLPDLVAATEDGTISLLLGGKDGAFQVVPFSVSGPISLSVGGLMVGDVTGDGKADIVFAPTGDNQVDGGVTEILENTCP